METNVYVIITTKNRPAYAANAISSATAQTEPAASIIVVDDGSDRPIEELIDPKLAESCKFIRNENSHGVSAARNIGMGYVEGKWAIFLDDDDWLSPTYVQELNKFLASSDGNVDFCWPSRTLVYDHTGKRVETNAPKASAAPILTDKKALNSLMETGCSGSAYRVSAFKTVGGFDETLVVSEDRDLTFRLLNAGYTGRQSVDARVYIRIHTGDRLSTPSASTAQAESDLLVLSKNADFLRDNPVLAERYIGRVAKRLWARGYKKEALNALNTLCKINPLSLRTQKRRLWWSIKLKFY